MRSAWCWDTSGVGRDLWRSAAAWASDHGGIQAVDFRKGMDSLVALVMQRLPPICSPATSSSFARSDRTV